MDNKMKFQKRFIGTLSMTLSAFLLSPAAYAHVLAITATTPFPAAVAATSSTIASFTVTNISKANITPVDISKYPPGSGLSTSSNTCGHLLKPNQSCAMQVTLQAPSNVKSISGALQVAGRPTVDGVQYPFTITITPGLPTITLEDVPFNSQLPALRDPVVAENGGTWLIMGGTTGNFHQFENTFFIPNMYAYNPSTTQLYSMNINSTNMPTAVKSQLASSNTEFLEDGDTLYIIGGFNTTDNINFTTLQTITAINIPGMINAIKTNNTNVAPFVTFNSSIPQFQVTGGQLGKIGNYFYLTFGHNCGGDNYCTPTQAYTNSIYQFTADPTLASLAIVNTATHLDNDNSGWRRRDYSLVPFMMGTTESLFAMGGPFTQGPDAVVWTNGIIFTGNLQANDNFINQQANQYFAPSLSMYSTSANASYVATFSGLSNLYWSSTGLVNDPTTPYGNILDLITYGGSVGKVQEYANVQPLCSGQPVASCLYMGLTAIFIPNTNTNYYDSRHILQMDKLPKNTKTLVGYVYAGLLSPVREIFTSTPPPNGPSYTTNKVYAVYVVPSGSGPTAWKNITNMYPGN